MPGQWHLLEELPIRLNKSCLSLFIREVNYHNFSLFEINLFNGHLIRYYSKQMKSLKIKKKKITTVF